MQLASADEAAAVRKAIEQGDMSALGQVATIVKRTGALDAAMHWAQSEISRALDSAKYLPSNHYRNCMIQLAEQSLVRNS